MLNNSVRHGVRCAAFLLASSLAAPPALAQDARDRTSLSRTAQDDRDADDQEAQAPPPPVQDQRPGRVADSSAGLAGQRQVRGQAVGGVEPMTRVNNRIQNRVQSRIRNRIDRYYDPGANAASPFEVAGDQARTAGKFRGR